MDGDSYEGITLNLGESGEQALFRYKTRVLKLEEEKKVRTVRIVKKEMNVLDVSDDKRIVRVRIHLIMSWYDSSFEAGDLQPGEISPPKWKPVCQFPSASPVAGPPVVTRDDYSFSFSNRKATTNQAEKDSQNFEKSESSWDRTTGIISNDREIVVSLDMPLNHYCFPYDRQTFEFSIRATSPEDIPFPRVALEATSGIPLMSATEEWIPFSGALGLFSCFNNSIRVVAFYERMSYYYVVNIALVLFFITGMAAYPFWIDPDQLSSRLQLNFTLVLTAVAFKYTVSTHLPRIPYLTYMDYFVLCNFAFIIMCGIEHVIAYRVARINENAAESIDLAFFIVAGLVWLFVHIVLVSLGSSGALRPEWNEQAQRDMREATPKTPASSNPGTVV